MKFDYIKVSFVVPIGVPYVNWSIPSAVRGKRRSDSTRVSFWTQCALTILKISFFAPLSVVAVHAVVTKKLTPPKNWVVYHLEINCGAVRDTVVRKVGVWASGFGVKVHAFITRDALILFSYCLKLSIWRVLKEMMNQNFTYAQLIVWFVCHVDYAFSASREKSTTC